MTDAPEMNQKKERLPDPLSEILRLKRKLNPKSSVAKSPFCDVIISMRMQGVNYHRIEKWLEQQGKEHRIPASTICRNTKHLEINLPYAEEMAERWGGRIDLDLARELAGQIVLQRTRVDRLQKQEDATQQGNPKYSDKRIRSERELLTIMIKELHAMMKNPLEAAMEAVAADQQGKVDMSQDAQEKVAEMILNGEIKLSADLASNSVH